jgi:MFS transporter, SP family, xylose:H+ symportor
VGGGMAFLLFFVCMVGQLLWVLKVMPETRGVPLEEMEANLGIELSEEDITGAQSGPRAH